MFIDVGVRAHSSRFRFHPLGEIALYLIASSASGGKSLLFTHILVASASGYLLVMAELKAIQHHLDINSF